MTQVRANNEVNAMNDYFDWKKGFLDAIGEHENGRMEEVHNLIRDLEDIYKARSVAEDVFNDYAHQTGRKMNGRAKATIREQMTEWDLSSTNANPRCKHV